MGACIHFGFGMELGLSILVHSIVQLWTHVTTSLCTYLIQRYRTMIYAHKCKTNEWCETPFADFIVSISISIGPQRLLFWGFLCFCNAPFIVMGNLMLKSFFPFQIEADRLNWANFRSSYGQFLVICRPSRQHIQQALEYY